MGETGLWVLDGAAGIPVLEFSQGQILVKAYGSKDVRRANWGGLKPIVRSVLLFPTINAAARMAGRVIGGAWLQRLPVAAARATYQGGVSVDLLDPRDCQVAAELFRNGGLPRLAADRRVLTFLEALALRCSTFLDIGAYTGLFALIAARSNPELKAVAFEIVPETYLLLTRNVIANDLIGRVEPRLCGLGPVPDTIVMPTALGSASLPSSLSISSTFEEGVRIPVARLDDLCGDIAGPVGIKIDVEGFEAAVLAGGSALLARHRPDIICEVLPGEGADVEAVLSPLGYAFHHFTATGLERRDRIAGVHGLRDWVFSVRDDPSELLSGA